MDVKINMNIAPMNENDKAKIINEEWKKMSPIDQKVI